MGFNSSNNCSTNSCSQLGGCELQDIGNVDTAGLNNGDMLCWHSASRTFINVSKEDIINSLEVYVNGGSYNAYEITLTDNSANTTDVVIDLSSVPDDLVADADFISDMAAALANMVAVSTNGTMSGDGTAGNPLIVNPITVSAGATNDVNDNSNGSAQLSPADSLHFFSNDDSINFVVSQGSVIVDGSVNMDVLEVATDGTINGNGSLASPLAVNIGALAGNIPVVASAPLTGNGTTVNPLDIDFSNLSTDDQLNINAIVVHPTAQEIATNICSDAFAQQVLSNCIFDDLSEDIASATSAPITGDGTAGNPLGLDIPALNEQVEVATSLPVIGNGTTASPVAIDEVALAAALASDVAVSVNAPLTGDGTSGAPLDIDFANLSAADEADINAIVIQNEYVNCAGAPIVDGDAIVDCTEFNTSQAVQDGRLDVIENTYITNADDVGVGNSVFAQKNGNDLEFKSISVAGPLSLNDNGSTITIENTQQVSSVGVGQTLVNNAGPANIEIKSIVGGGDIVVAGAGNEVSISFTETLTSISGDNANHTITYINENGLPTVIDVAGLVSDFNLNGGSITNGILTLVDNSGLTPNVTVDLNQFYSDITFTAGVYMHDRGDGTITNIDVNASALPFNDGPVNFSAPDVQGAIESLETLYNQSVTDGVNIGGQVQLFSAKNGQDLEFRTIQATGSVDVAQTGDTVTINSNALETIASDGSITGDGTAGNPLSVDWLDGSAQVPVATDATISGNGTLLNPLSVDGPQLGGQVPVVANAPLTGNGTTLNPLDIDEAALALALASDVAVSTNLPITGDGTAANPLDIDYSALTAADSLNIVNSIAGNPAALQALCDAIYPCIHGKLVDFGTAGAGILSIDCNGDGNPLT